MCIDVAPTNTHSTATALHTKQWSFPIQSFINLGMQVILRLSEWHVVPTYTHTHIHTMHACYQCLYVKYFRTSRAFAHHIQVLALFDGAQVRKINAGPSSTIGVILIHDQNQDLARLLQNFQGSIQSQRVPGLELAPGHRMEMSSHALPACM